jgi:uracil-xanthine permease
MTTKLRLWTVHGDGKHIPPTEVVAPDERLAWPQTIGLGIQHVFAMFGATFLVPVLIGFPPNTTLFFSGIGTMLFLLITIGRGQRLGLPSYLGSSFAFISPVIIAKQHGGIPSALAGIFAAGAILVVVGFLVNKWGTRFIEWLMPPVVTGTIVALIGLNLAGSAFNNINLQPWTGVISLVVVVAVTVAFRGFFGRLSILIGVVAGYLFACTQGNFHWTDLGGFKHVGQVNFDAVRHAAWVGLPHFTGPHFSMRPIYLVLPVVLVLIAENTGHIKAVASMTGRNLDKSLGRGYMADGAATMLAGLGGGSGTTTYAENIGVMAASKVYSTAAYWVAGAVAVAFGCIPKLGALINTIPVGVLGGVGTVLYGMIAVLGGRIWVENRVNFTNPVNLLPAAIGLVAGSGNYTISADHGNFVLNGIAVGSFAAIIVYQLMNFLSKRGVFRDGAPAIFAPVIMVPGENSVLPTPRQTDESGHESRPPAPAV